MTMLGLLKKTAAFQCSANLAHCTSPATLPWNFLINTAFEDAAFILGEAFTSLFPSQMRRLWKTAFNRGNTVCSVSRKLDLLTSIEAI